MNSPHTKSTTEPPHQCPYHRQHHHHHHHLLFIHPSSLSSPHHHLHLHHHHHHYHVLPQSNNIPQNPNSNFCPNLINPPPQIPEPEAPPTSQYTLNFKDDDHDEFEEVLDEDEDPIFVMTDEWREFFAKSEARRRAAKKLAKKQGKT
ncbi:hypothetical protein SOVF_049990 [Spinacia oleracea]|uniref:SKI-interacting protein SKIP SNW domain-containing protein n=1 Tax=Spinacia oleracea TaxID=3562 RepID=A0A9R0JAT2_SPIOL|nr:uncharacterized protein LOC110803245 [Spinacia oleracea]KNA20710.1 hypothetical protein SOVF_049990 [Spinacia oleracea]